MVAADTNVHCFSTLVGVGEGDEELVAPVKVQITSGVTANITVLRQKNNGDDPLISDTDCFLAVMTGSEFNVFDDVNKLNRLYYHFSTAIGSPSFLWSCGF